MKWIKERKYQKANKDWFAQSMNFRYVSLGKVKCTIMIDRYLCIE